MLSVLKEIIYAPYSVVKGLIITVIHLFRPKVTLQYPEERWDLPENYRGIPSLPIDQKTGADRCIACGACARICPEQVITVTSDVGEDKKRKLRDFNLDASRCMWCGLCVEVCPTDALVMSKEYELATDTREKMVYNKDDMHTHGGMFPAEPEPEPEKPSADASASEQSGDPEASQASERSGDPEASTGAAPSDTSNMSDRSDASNQQPTTNNQQPEETQ